MTIAPRSTTPTQPTEIAVRGDARQRLVEARGLSPQQPLVDAKQVACSSACRRAGSWRRRARSACPTIASATTSASTWTS